MHPYLSLGPGILLDSWRVMNSLGLLAGGLVALLVLRSRLGWARACPLVLFMLTAAMLGAHLAHCLLHGCSDLRRWLTFWEGGHSFFGALILCGLLLLVLSRLSSRIDFLATADAFALGTPLGLAFARVGCYMKGCCWGIPLPDGHPFQGVFLKLVDHRLTSLHPVQLYSAAAALTIFLVLLYLWRKAPTPGVLTAGFALLYGTARLLLEHLRADTQSEMVLGLLTVHQGVCVLLIAGAVGFLLGRERIVKR